MCVCECMCGGRACGAGGSTTGLLGVKRFLVFFALFSFFLNKLPCPSANQSKTNIVFHSLDLFE